MYDENQSLYTRDTPLGIVTYGTSERKIRLIKPSGEILEELETMEALRSIRYPLKCKYVVTGACNQRCYHCYTESRFSEGGLPTDKALAVIDRVADVGTLFLEFFGGEVGTRKDFTELINHAANRDMVVGFFTNGTRFDLARVDEFPPPSSFAAIIISLLAGEEVEHDRLARLKGAWQKAFDLARVLRDRNYPVSMTVSVTKQSVSTLRRLMEFTKAEGLPLRTIFNTYAEVNQARDFQDIALTEEEMISLGKETPEIASRKFRQKPCFGGTVTYSIGTDGALMGCDHVTAKLGSVLDRPIDDIWKDKATLTFTEDLYKVPERCKTCPNDLSQYCTYCPATALKNGLPKSDWVDYFCGLAERKQRMQLAASNATQPEASS